MCELSQMQLNVILFEDLASSHPEESIFLTIPWKSCYKIIQYIVQYYIFYFYYRLKPLSIEYSSTINQKSSKLHQSTSTSSIYLVSTKFQQSIATQTSPFSKLDCSDIHKTNNVEHRRDNSQKRKRFRFNKPTLSSSSILTSLFCHSSLVPVRSNKSSSKSSSASGRRSFTISSSNPTRHLQSLNQSSRMESDQDPISTVEYRSHTSASSSSLLHTTCRYGSHKFTHYHEPMRLQQHQSRSVNMLSNSTKLFQQQQLSSVTNTNSSDSSCVMHYYSGKLLSTIAHQQRTRDEDIVAANERKALRVLMIIFSVFIILWTPFFICTFISAICEQCRERISSTIWFSITWLGYSSSMANPFIYTIFSDVFRRAFANIICCRPTESIIPGQCSTKLSSPKHLLHQYISNNLSCRRSPNPDISDTSSPILLHRPRSFADSDGKINVNRHASGPLR